VLRGNLRQFFRSSYVYFFQIPWLPEWLLRRNGYALMRRAVSATAHPGAFTATDLDRYTQAWAQPGALRTMLGWYRAFMRRSGRTFRESARLPRYAMPALLLWGEQDVALGVELAEQSARLLANGRLVRLPEATHWVQHDFPDLVNKYLLEHLAAG
jgi:pimeloyl-ACP methyl ester carboxylesterase